MAPGLNLEEFLDGICAPGPGEDLWKKDFSPGKEFTGTSWDLKGISGNAKLLFPLFPPEENLFFEY